ncbi:hypothetical protein J4G37_57185, partial [Microvirga sp. 3-52]|nr:hypothetical protein [Microvirga sp. 3-52]
MKKNKLLIMLFSALFLVVGCTQKNTIDPPVDKKTNQDSEKEEKVDDQTTDADDKKTLEVAMINFFLPDGSSAHYEGDGNEFAELNIEVTHIDSKYVVIDE